MTTPKKKAAKLASPSKPKLVKPKTPIAHVPAEHVTLDEILPEKPKPFVSPEFISGKPVDHSSEYVQSSGSDSETLVIRPTPEPRVMTHAPGCVLGDHKGSCLDGESAAGLHVVPNSEYAEESKPNLLRTIAICVAVVVVLAVAGLA
jgi:hypothetical protein